MLSLSAAIVNLIGSAFFTSVGNYGSAVFLFGLFLLNLLFIPSNK